MRFLVVTTNRDPVTPDVGLGLIRMMQAWVDEHTASGKMKETWSFAGTIGGGGILEVESHEELDAIMGGFPFAQVSNVDVYPLADLHASLEGAEARMQAALQMMAVQR
jgi:muconolactone delta-isomerase